MNVVNIIFIVIIFTIPCFTQTREVEFVKPDSLHGFYEYSFNDDEFIGLMKIKNSNNSECDYKYVTYNSNTGAIENIQDFYYLISEKYCLYPQELFVEVDTKYLYSTPPDLGENNQLVLTVTDNDTSNLYQQKWDEVQDRILDMEIQHFNDDGIGYISEYESEQNNSRTIRFLNFKITGDSLTKELLNVSTTKSQLSVGVFSVMNDDYITSFALYQDLLEYTGPVVDSVCGIDIYRFDKSDNSIDSTFVPFDSNYRFVEGTMNEDRFIFPLIGQDSSIKNAYFLSNKFKIFSYDIPKNELSIEKEVSFKKNIGINGFHYDKNTDRYYVYGYSTDAGQYSASYTDYWLAILDSEFNIILDYTWKEEEVERLEEYVHSFEPLGENKFYITYGSNDITGQLKGNSFSGIISLDILASINREKENPLISFYPNPAKDYLTVSNQTLPYNLKIFDLAGNIIKENNLIFNNEHQIDLTNLSTGTYVLNIGNDYFKFIKE